MVKMVDNPKVEDSMKRIVGAALMLALMSPAAAQAATVKCKPGKYGGYDKDAFPVVYKLRAVNLPKKTDGYAPPCLVADSVAGRIQQGFAENEELPDTVHPMGARWDGGVFICVYREVQGDYVPYQVAKCHVKGRSSRKVTMELGS